MMQVTPPHQQTKVKKLYTIEVQAGDERLFPINSKLLMGSLSQGI